MSLILPSRRGLLTGVAALAAMAALPPDEAAAQLLSTTGAGLGAASGGCPAGATWNTPPAAITLTNCNLTATQNTNASQTMPRATGVGIAAATKRFFELTVVYTGSDNAQIAIGVCEASVANTGVYIGQTIHSGGITLDGQYLFNNGATGSGVNPYGLSGDTYLIAMNGANFYVFNSRNGGYNNGAADPVANTGGQNFTGITFPVFPAISLYDVNDACTANFSGSGYVNTTQIALLLAGGFTAYTG